MASSGRTHVDDQVRAWFESADLDKSGSIDVLELQRALKLAGLEFGSNMCAMLIRMHDLDRNGSMGMEEFQHMHNFLMSVRASFFQFDQDRSGHLDRDELLKALQLNGFWLSKPAFDAIFNSFDIHNKNALELADYIAMASFLTSSRSMFSRLDPFSTGRVNIDFNQFCYSMSFLR